MLTPRWVDTRSQPVAIDDVVSTLATLEDAPARPLVEGLSAEMIVKHPPPPGINDDPKGFHEAVRAGLG